MDRRTFVAAGGLFAAGLALAGTTGHAEAAPAAAPKNTADGREEVLPAPDTTGGKPLMECMKLRRSTHRPGNGEITRQDLANVLWAACGITGESGKRTVPTARNRQRIEVYAVLGDGVWLYVPEKNAIRRVLAGDQRSRFDGSGCVLLYAAPDSDPHAGVHVGSMYQNVSLYCASEGIRNCVKEQKREALKKVLPLQQGWSVVMSHSLSR